ncbi:MAG TPA: GAF domain-containing protein [Longimicrobium sp.]
MSPVREPPPAQSAAFAIFCGELADTLARPAERKRNLVRLAEALGALAGGSAVVLFTPAPDGVLQCDVGTAALAHLEGDLVPADGTLEGEAFTSREARTSPNLRADPRAFLPVQRALPNAPALATPLLSASGCAGVALLAKPRRDTEFAPSEIATLQLAATLVGGALQSFGEHERVRASRAVIEMWRAGRKESEGDADAARSVLRAVRHELNTPVAVISSNLQLCASPDPADWKLPAPELWQAMRAGAARLEEVSRLLRALDESDGPIALDEQGRFILPGSTNGHPK